MSAHNPAQVIVIQKTSTVHWRLRCPHCNWVKNHGITNILEALAVVGDHIRRMHPRIVNAYTESEAFKKQIVLEFPGSTVVDV